MSFKLRLFFFRLCLFSVTFALPVPSSRKLAHIFSSGIDHLEVLAWAVKINHVSGGPYNSRDNAADKVANAFGLQNRGQIGALDGVYLMTHPADNRVLFHGLDSRTLRSSIVDEYSTQSRKSSHFHLSPPVLDHGTIRDQIHRQLDVHPFVEWYHQQRISPRSKRSTFSAPPLSVIWRPSRRKRTAQQQGPLDLTPLRINDPYFYKQWHLLNTLNPGMDINVTGVWLHNVTGRGVTVAVIDDGLEWTNVDLLANYNSNGSFDLNSGDDNPMPDAKKPTNHHGTRCAGEIAAVAGNGVCGIGVAYGSWLSGVRILDGPMTDVLEATAFTKKYDINDIYSCSWGPEDDGKTIDGPQHVAITGMRHGVDFGRRGYGAIYVVASGNGGIFGDNCNYDGYANIIYTVTIGAVGEDGKMPYYGEECASMLAVTFSNGYRRNIVTTDWTLDGGTGCTESHSGTSAAAPIAAALVALMLEVRPCLTWRDVQHIIAVTAVKIDLDGAQWTRNAAGLYHSHQHGFGLMNAWRMVNTAKIWPSVPWMTVYTSSEVVVNLDIPAHKPLQSQLLVTDSELSGYSLATLEYVHVTVTLSHEHRGDIELTLTCPSGTSSIIGATRRLDDSKDGFKEWTFSTVRCWGETAAGMWTVIVSDKGNGIRTSRGKLEKWTLKLFGSPMTSDEFQQRLQLVQKASSGEYLRANFQLPCPPPPVKTIAEPPISEKVLKIVSLTSVFVVILALYDTFEYAFCYGDEKRQLYREWLLRRRQQAEAGDATAAAAATSRDIATELASAADAVESTRLLAADDDDVAVETIAMETMPPTVVGDDAVRNLSFQTVAVVENAAFHLSDDNDDDESSELLQKSS